MAGKTRAERSEYYEKNKERFKARAKLWREKNRSYLLAYAKEWKSKNRIWIRDQSRFKRLGITAEMYDAKLKEQGGVCGLCGLPFVDFDLGAPRADHDHATGAFRGVLHRHCNLGLGTFNDDIQLLEMAIAYLRKSKQEEIYVGLPTLRDSVQ